MACWVGVSCTPSRKAANVPHGQIADLGDVLSPHRDGERLLFQALSVTVGAVGRAHIPLDVPLDAHRARLIVPPLQVVDKALPRALVVGMEGARAVFQVDLLAAVAVHEKVEYLLGQVFDGDVHGKPVPAGSAPRYICVTAEESRFQPLMRMAPSRSVLVRSGQMRSASTVCLNPSPEQVGAGAPRRVEGEQPRLDLLDGDVAVGTGIAGGIERLLAAAVDDDQPVRKVQRALQTLGEALQDPLLDDQAVDDDADVVLDVLVKPDLFLQIVDGAVDLDADIPALAVARQFLDVLALSAAHDGRVHHDLAARRQRHDLVGDLVHRLPTDLPSALGTVRDRPRAQTKDADSRRSPSPSPPSNGDCATSSSDRWRSRAKVRRWTPRPAFPSCRGTGGHRRRGSPYSGAAPRQRWCRTRASIFQTPKVP